jgi:tetratricopeptide (TPR) repeat protein
VGYRERFTEVVTERGWDAGLDFLRSIFHSSARQKPKGSPTDYLSDKDDDKVTLGEGFDALVAGFKPRETLDKRVAFVLERLAEGREQDEARHVFQPFNTIAFRMGSYERCDASILSLHVTPEDTVVSIFGLEHELVRDGDSHEEYTFTYDLEYNPDQYQLELDGEELSGPLLHHDVKMCVFARWLSQLVGKLVAHPDFAAFPKVLPFSFVMVGATDYGKLPELRAPLVPPVTEATLADNPHRDAWLEAAVIRGDTGHEARFIFLVPSMSEPGSPQGQELVALVKQHPELRELITTLANEALAETKAEREAGPRKRRWYTDDEETPPLPDDLRGRVLKRYRGSMLAYAPLLIALGDRPAALAYAEAILRLPFPPAWTSEPDDREDVYRAVNEELELRRTLLRSMSEEDRAAVRPAWEDALARLTARGAEEPICDLLLAERDAALAMQAKAQAAAADDDDDDRDDDGESDDDSDGDDDGDGDGGLDLSMFSDDDDDGGVTSSDTSPWPGRWLAEELEDLEPHVKALCDEASPAYLDILMRCVRAAPQAMRGYGEYWDLLYKRLLAVGPRNAAGIPEILAWADRWCMPPDRRVETQLAVYFGKMLMTMGLEDVPRFMHLAHDDNQFMVEDIYPRWSTEVPKRRLARFVEQFTQDPRRFEGPAAWEEIIYDSPPGLAMLLKTIVGSGGAGKLPAAVSTDDVLARLEVALAAPGPLLTKLAYKLADHYAKQDGQWGRVLSILTAMPSVDEDHVAVLRRARLADALTALDTNASDAGERVARMRAAFPERGVAWLLEARHALATDGPAAAGASAHAALRALSVDDLVYRKAVCEYGGVPLGAWDQLTDASAYAFFRIALDEFRDSHYDNGVFTGGGSALDDDPFYEAIAREISQRTPAERAEDFAGWRAELVFAGESKAMPDDVLAQHVDLGRWQVSWAIAQRLAATPGAEPWRIETLLRIWGAFAADKDRRMSLGKLIWPVEAWRKQFVLDDNVHPHLTWFIERWPGSSEDVARAVFAIQREVGKPERVLDVVRTLDDRYIVNTFLSIVPAYQALGDYAGAAALLKKIRDDISPKKPDYVLVTGNIAAMLMQGGDPKAAEEVLDELFAMDWSRFDYKGKDSFAETVLGGDLDAQLARAFRIYMGMAKFNVACIYAQTKRSAKAVAALREATKLNPPGYPAAKVRAEADFAPLAGDDAFEKLVGGLP